ncbi:MAG: sigma-70 family RNA polymerase sigma factor [Candidatus Micrarchaeia archaeon]
MKAAYSRLAPQQERQRSRLSSAGPLSEAPRINRWKSLSDSEVLEFARNFISRSNILSRTQVANSHSRLYRELRTRGLFDELGLSPEPPLSSLSDEALVSRAKKLKDEGNFVRRSHFRKAHYGIYDELRKRGLVGELGFEQAGTDRSSMSNEELVAQANNIVREEGISSVTEFIERHGAVYKALCDRALHLQLGIKRKYVDWSGVPDSGLISIAQKKMLEKGICNPGSFKKAFPGVYKQLRKRGLVEKAGFRPAYSSLHRLPATKLIRQAKQFILKHDVSSVSELQNTPGGWQWYNELSGRGLLPAVGLSPKIMRWGRLSDAELMLCANKEIGRMQVFTAQELRKKNQKLYQAINTRSKKSPGIWARINLLTRAGLSQKNENPPDQKELGEWLRKFVRRDGIATPEELRSCCRMLFSAMERKGMDVAQEITACRFPVPDPRRSSEDANRILEENLDLVPIIIRKRNLTRHLSYSEAEQLARISLLKSAFRWDGIREFRSYAMQNSVDTWRSVYREAETVYVPPHVRARAEGYSKWCQRNPSGTFDEYAEEMNIPEKEREFYRGELPKHNGSLLALKTGKPKIFGEEMQEALESNPVKLSTLSFLSTEKKDPQENPEDALEASQFREGVHALLGFLPKRERKMVSMYFGLNGYGPMQLSEIGEKYGISKQRISQIILRGLEGISKNPAARKHIRDFL